MDVDDRPADVTDVTADRSSLVDPADSEQSSDALKRALRAVKDMKARVARAEDAAHEPIAIVGVGCRLPGAQDPEQYWQLLRDGVDAIGDVPADRWDIEEYYDPDPTVPGKMVTRQGGFVRDIDLFDPQFFGITPREAVTMDPQQRLLMEVGWEALESAGIAPASLAGSLTGTYVGMAPGDYGTVGSARIADGSMELDAYFGTGNAMSVSSGRLAYALGLHGPNLAVDAACASSLVAVHLAVQGLRRREADVAIAGGVNIMLDPMRSAYMSKTGALSPTSRCRTFDASADGYVRGEGCGMVVLKRLADAVADRDNVLAVVHGSAVNHDGRSGGLTVPNGRAQQAVMRAALADARLDPDAVSYVEAFGAGTPLGDPIEVRAVDAVYGGGPDEPLWVGSSKTNLGHLEAAAGIAGLIKVVLSLQHRTIPRHLHFDQPSPHIDWESTRIQVPTRSIDWSDDGRARIAGLSSFSLSGTNCHLIVGEPSAQPDPEGGQGPIEVGEAADPRILPLSGRSPDAVTELALAVASTLAAPDAPELADAAHTLGVGRNEMANRIAVVTSGSEDAADLLTRHVRGERPPMVVSGDASAAQSPKIAFLFSGHGTEHPGMGRQLYDSNSAFRDAFDACAKCFDAHLDPGLSSMYSSSGADHSVIGRVTHAPAALFAVEYSMAAMWEAWGVRPDMMLGHSVGSLVAAHLDGVLSLDDAVHLVAAQGRLMATLPSSGAMLTVFADESTVAAALEPFAGRVAIAAINGPDNVVLAGASPDLDAIEAELARAGIDTLPLAATAYHSPLVEPFLDDYEAVAAGIDLRSPSGRRLVSDHTGAVGDERMATAAYWARHVREPVRFADGITTLHDAGCNAFVEIGPSAALATIGERCLPDERALWLPTIVDERPELDQALLALAELWTNGVAVEWRSFDPNGARRRVQLPTTRFQRSRYWLPEPSADHIGPTRGHPLLGGRSTSSGRQVRFDAQLTPARATFLHDYVARGRTELPAVAHAETLLAAGAELWGHDVPLVVHDIEVHEPLEVGDEPMHQQTTVSPVGRSDASVTIDVHRPDTGEWDHLADGRVSIDRDRADPARVDLDVLCDGLEAVPIDDLLSSWAGAGLVLGDRFRCITQLWTSGERTVAELALPFDAVRYSSYPPALAVCALALRGDGAVRTVTRIGALRQYSSHPATWCEIVPHDSGGSLRFIDEEGGVVAEVSDVVLVEDEHDRLPARAAWCYDVVWTESAAVDLTAAPADARWMVIGADDGVCGRVCDRLASAGVECGRIDESALDGHADNAGDDEDGFAAIVRQWLDPGAGDRPPANVVYVVASDETVDADRADDEPIDIAFARVNRLLRLVQTLALEAQRAKVATPPKIWLVTRAAIAAGHNEVSPADRALWATMKTVAAELPALYGGMVDLDPAPANSDDEPRQIVGAIAGSGDETWLAIRGDGARVARLRPDPPALDRPPLALRADGAYLVTGGFGALAMATARWLIDRGARRLVMLGRTPVPPRTEWAELQPGDAATTPVDAVRELEALGAIVHHPAVDIADRDALRAVLDDYRAAGWPPIRGVFHAAGERRDRSISQMQAADVATVFGSKARGAWNLHCLLANEPLDHFVCYSSVAAALGSPGQANSAAANGFLDGLVHLRRGAGRAGLSVNWGPWRAGMAATEEVERRREPGGVPPIPVIGGLAVLGELMAADATQAVVMPMTPARWSMVESPLFADLLLEDDATTRSVDDVGADLLSRPADERSSKVLEAVCIEVGAVAGLDVDDVPTQLGLIEVGLDSIMILELATALSRRFGVALHPREIFEQPTISDLAALIEAEGLSGTSSKIGRVDRGEALPLSFAQERMWFLQQFEDDTSGLILRAAVRIRGALDVEVLARSIDALTQRHETLRTLYDDVMGEPAPRLLENVATPLTVDDMRGAADPEDIATQVLSEEADRRFDLTSEPPLSVRLVRVADDDEILSVVTHHIASDGLSIPILLRDLSAFYDAFSDGTEPVLPELPIDYVDYAAWQRGQDSDTFDSQLKYWTAQLGSDLGNCELPTDHRRPPVHTVDGAQIVRTVPDDLVDGLRELGRRNGATLFMTLLAPFLLVLDRRIGRDDRSVTIGTPVAGRVRPELQDLIGVFLNTLVLRTDLSGDPSFDELLGRVRDVSLDAFANQDVPFERLLAELQPPRDLSRTPFFSVLFNMISVDFEQHEGAFERLVGHDYEVLEQPDLGSQFDLTMYVGEQRRGDGDGVSMQLVYNRHLYDAATMKELFDQYLGLLEAVVADPRRPISTYSLITDAARYSLPDLTTELDATWHGSVPEHVGRHASESPDRIAVADDSTTWRYAELAADMNRLANWLGRQGVGRGDVVAIYGHRSASLVWAVTGALAAGAGYTILDPAYPPARLAEYLRIVRPRALVHLEAGAAVPDDVVDELDELDVEARVRLPALRPADGDGPLAGESSDPPIVQIGPDDLACVTMTSGSTGEPRAVLGRHGSLTHFLPWQSDAFQVGADDRFSMLSGLAHDPIQRDMFWPLAIGASIVVPDPAQIPTPGWLARWMREERVTVAHLTPAMGQLVLETPQTAPDADAPIEPLRLALFIGEPLPRDLVDRLQARAPDVTIVNLYGTTETQRASGHLVLDRGVDLGDRTVVPLGVGIPGTQMLVRSGDGTEAGIGEIGEIWMRSHHLALGYLDRDADTAARFSPTPGATAPTDRMYRTGDLGRYRADGSVEFVGRADNQVQIRGFRVELGDVRAALCEHDDVADAVVVMHDAGDHTPARLVAYVVDGGTAPDPAELSAFLRSRLPTHMVPASLVPIGAIPLTPNGKLDREALPEPVIATVDEGEAARDSLEQLLVGLWEDVLDRPQVGIHDNFFDLGGYSLLATRLFALIEEAIGEQVPVATLFRAPTVAELAAVIRDSGWESRWSSLVPIQPRGGQLPLYYVNSYLISVLQLANLGDQLGENDQPLYGLQPRGIEGDLPPLESIEEMAAHYIKEIKSVQPHGPYAVGGHCSGSWVAFEMARQLEQMGDDVSAVLLVDLGPPGVERPEIPVWRYVLHRFKFFYGDGRLRHALAWQLKILVNRLLLRRMGSEVIRTQATVQAAHHRAHRAYTGGQVSCNLVLIRSHETLALGDRGWFLKWKEKTSGELFVPDHVVGVHSDMLEQPNVEDLAAKMLESLEWSRSRSAAGSELR